MKKFWSKVVEVFNGYMWLLAMWIGYRRQIKAGVKKPFSLNREDYKGTKYEWKEE